jgi:trehalose 6-phosphate phosphatase
MSMLPHLLSAQGDLALATALQRRPLLAFDFDGTLAPIVARPADARVSVALARRLEKLSRRLPVAVITGRSVEDVTRRLRFAPRYVVGNHGAEDPSAPAPAPLQQALEPLRERLRAEAAALDAAGVNVEDKRFSIALHYRCARDPERAQTLITSLLHRPEERTRVFGGKRVVNVVANNAPDKADAVLQLLQRTGAGAVVYLGDDVNDEVVFERAQPHWLTVRVGRDDPRSKAAFCLDSPAEVGIVLHKMLTTLGETTDG